jgi:signal transduction histidine kinase
LLTITNSLLDVTWIEAGRVELLLQPMNLPDLVETVAAEYHPQLEARPSTSCCACLLICRPRCVPRREPRRLSATW